MRNTFIFLYPQDEIFSAEIERGYHLTRKEHESKTAAQSNFKQAYKEKMNQCINERYRKQGFEIVYALLDKSELSDIIIHYPRDRIINVGIDAATHRTQRADGSFPYPDNDYILNQLSPKHLRIAGFHMWDCVAKLAKRAHERKINVLVDEDLTEFFTGRFLKADFNPFNYPGYNPRLERKIFFEVFMEARKGSPWLLQHYPRIKGRRRSSHDI